jgi:hypothetical protein
MNTDLQYRTFDELMAAVASDFRMYDLEGMIEPGDLIKVAQRVTYDLGLRIHKTKEAVLEITKGKARLPLDFYVLNNAMLLGQYKVKRPVLAGRQTEEMQLVVAPNVCASCGSEATVCACNQTYSTTEQYGDNCGDFIVVEKIRTETRVYDHFERVHMNPSKFISRYAQSLGLAGDSDKWHADIRDGFIHTNLEEGKIYINYEGSLEDEEGNLLVLDHPMINEYYEYALKKRILENLFMNGEDSTAQKIQLIEPLYRASRNNALSIVNTPNFKDMHRLWSLNRTAQYNKYYAMFSSASNITHK